MASNDEKALFCPSCGLRVKPDHQFCLGCGAPLKSATTSPPNYSYTPPSTSAMPSSTSLPTPVTPLPSPQKKVDAGRIAVNYAISVIVFLIAIGIVSGILASAGADEQAISFLSPVIASAVAGLVGGYVTKQHVPFKVVGSIILVIVGIAAILIFLAYQSAQQSASPYAALGFAIILIVVIALTIILSIIFVLHAGFAYIGAKLRE